MSNKFVRLNTVFKLPEDIAKKAIDLSREIAKNNEVVFVLDGVQFHPHITIYSPEYPEANLEKILMVVEKITDKTNQTTLDFQSIKNNQGSIIVHFKLSPEIKSLHEEIVKELNLFREDHTREKYKPGSDYHLDFSQEQLKNIAEYGYPDAMSLYKPHITIIRLKDNSLAETIANTISWEPAHFTVNKLAVYTMGESGTCKDLVKEFILK